MAVGKSEVDCLFDVFCKNKELVTDFGIYEFLGRTMAASGTGLHYLRDLLAGITDVCPGAYFEPVTIKMAVIRLLDKHSSLNSSDKLGKTVWAALKTERLVTILYHFRRVVRDTKVWTTMTSRMPQLQMHELNVVRASVKLPPSSASAADLTEEPPFTPQKAEAEGISGPCTSADTGEFQTATKQSNLKELLKLGEPGFPWGLLG